MKGACLTFAALPQLSGAVFAQQTLTVVPSGGDTTQLEAQMLHRPFEQKAGVVSANSCVGLVPLRAQVESIAVILDYETSLSFEALRTVISTWPLAPAAGRPAAKNDFIKVVLDCPAGIAGRAVRFG